MSKETTNPRPNNSIKQFERFVDNAKGDFSDADWSDYYSIKIVKDLSNIYLMYDSPETKTFIIEFTTAELEELAIFLNYVFEERKDIKQLFTDLTGNNDFTYFIEGAVKMTKTELKNLDSARRKIINTSPFFST